MILTILSIIGGLFILSCTFIAGAMWMAAGIMRDIKRLGGR